MELKIATFDEDISSIFLQMLSNISYLVNMRKWLITAVRSTFPMIVI